MKLIEVSCPGCQGSQLKNIAAVFLSPVRVFSQLKECLRCHLAFVSPRPSKDYEKSFYESEYFELETEVHWKQTRLCFFADAISRIEKKTSARTLLDVGCGGGYFLDLARKKGWAVRGTELSSQAVRVAKENMSLDVYQGEIFDAGFAPKTFSVITFWNVLDQMENPSEQIKKARELLKENGLIALRLSNLDFHLSLQKCWRFFLGLGLIRKEAGQPTVFHLEMFNQKSVKRFFQRHGFTQVEVFNAVLDPSPKALSRLIGPSLASFCSRFGYYLFEFLRCISFGNWIFGPSLLVFARKGDCDKAPS